MPPAPAIYSCVKFFTPGSPQPLPYRETVSAIIDAASGTPFAVRSFIVIGGNVKKDELTYWGMPETPADYFGNSGFHYDNGILHDTTEGSTGQGECNDFAAKICSGAVGYGYALMDTFPDIFFGGYIGGFGYVNNVQVGSFDIVWDKQDRNNGATRMLLCLGGPGYDITFIAGAANGYHGPPILPLPGIPQGIIQMSVQLGAHGSGPCQTGAGGSTLEIGWDTRGGNRGAAYGSCGNQGGNQSQHYLDRMSDPGPHVTEWHDTYYVVAGGNGGGGMQVIWCGEFLRCEAGKFRLPATDAPVNFNTRLNTKAIIFATAGTATALVPDDTRASISVGFADPALGQGSFWTGETSVGNVSPLKGSRYLSSHAVTRTGTSIGGGTTFQNIGQVTQLSRSGASSLMVTGADGTQPEVIWFAIGTEPLPDTSVPPGSNPICLVPEPHAVTAPHSPCRVPLPPPVFTR